MKYKTRYIANSFKQEESIDFVEIFANIVKLILYKYLFKVNIKQGYKIWQIDIITAFLYNFFDEIIYIEKPYLLKLNLKLVYCLCKVLYRLKQAP